MLGDGSTPKPVATDRARQLLLQAASALVHLRHENIVHRDLKLDNLLIALDGSLRVADLGLAKDCSQKDDSGLEANLLSTLRKERGAVWYRSPENFTEVPISFPHDMFALGLVLSEMLTGKLVNARVHGRLTPACLGILIPQWYTSAASAETQTSHDGGNVSNPGTLNAWLRKHHGYVGDNNLDEAAVRLLLQAQTVNRGQLCSTLVCSHRFQPLPNPVTLPSAAAVPAATPPF